LKTTFPNDDGTTSVYELCDTLARVRVGAGPFPEKIVAFGYH
jgi:hypothetical protein